MDAYVRRTEAVLAQWGGMPITTIYFGGGTPSLLGPERLSRLLRQARKSFPLAPPGEATLEANPTHVNEAFFAALAEAGFTRLSMGMQSADREELKLLGRAHSPENVEEAVKAAQRAGFRNISLDMMLGLPGGSREKLGRTIAFASGLGVQHISAYILKVEPGTPFASAGLVLPDGDETAEEYLFCVEELARQGFFQYEISNFSRPGFESRHNLIYWQGEEYLGIGPGAHSFQNGRRFYFPRDLEGFLAGSAPADDGPGGSFPEYAMLRLRLTEGLSEAGCGETPKPAHPILSGYPPSPSGSPRKASWCQMPCCCACWRTRGHKAYALGRPPAQGVSKAGILKNEETQKFRPPFQRWWGI